MKKLHVFLGALLCAGSLWATDLFTGSEGEIRYITPETARVHPAVQYRLRQQEAWQQFIGQNGFWSVVFDEFSQLPHRAFGTPVAVPATDDWNRALGFLQNNLAVFQLPVSQLRPVQVNRGHKETFVNFTQEYQGLPVLFSNAQVGINRSGLINSFRLNLYRDISLDLQITVTPEAARQLAANDLPYPVTDVQTESGLSVLPVPEPGEGYTYHLVYIVWVETMDNEDLPGRFYTLVDAKTGKIWYRQNRIHTILPPGSVSADIEASVVSNPLVSSSVKRLPYIKATVQGGNYYADASGHLNTPFNTQVSATITLEGRYARAIVDAVGVPASFSATLQNGTNLIDFNPHADSTAIAAYYHVTTVHDFMKSILAPGFTMLDTPIVAYVDITSGSCNAFYNGDVNFFAAGNGCAATALFDDVVYHEYGHGISHLYYSYLGSFFNNGGLGEGYSDVWAFLITGNPVLAQGFAGGASSYIRRYDQAPAVYPQDLIGEPHADGEIIAGAWWDLYVNLGNMDTVASLFAETLLATDMEPDGQEGKLYRDVLISCLLADDNDGNILNGTPNDSAIIQAFARHGITLITNSQLIHTELNMVPDTVATDINATLIVDLPVYLGDVDVHYRVHKDSTYHQLPMSNTTGTQYTAVIPQQPKGTIVDYYFTVSDIFGNVAVVEPFLANDANPNLPYQFLVGFEIKEKEDYDNTFGNWAIDPDGNDDAQTGQWDILSPIPSYSDPPFNTNIVQTGQDHTTEGANLNLCAVTGNAPAFSSMGTNDVDDGQTTLQSPVYDLTNYTTPAFSYWRWYINDPPGGANPGNDTWKVFISNDGINWVKVERTNVSDKRWRRHAIRVADYVTPTATVSLRFVASDSLIPGLPFDGGSIVEAAVDDLYLYDEAPEVNTGIEEPDLQVRLYPNPARDYLVLEVTGGRLENGSLEILDMLGRSLYSETVGYDEGRIVLPLSGFSAGAYALKLSGRNYSLQRTFVVE